MKHNLRVVSLREAAEQIAVQTTGWVGHLPGQTERIIRGQTFLSREAGDLDHIDIFSISVAEAGTLLLTLHEYQPETRSWGPVLGMADILVREQDAGRWISFLMPSVHLKKGAFYGFKLVSRSACIGLGEASGNHMQPPFNPGQEWEFTGDDEVGYCFSYFSLAFKVGLRA